MKKLISMLFALLIIANATKADTKNSADSPSLYERLGGKEGITSIVDDVIAAHMANPAISAIFEPYKTDRKSVV